ncbi:RNA-binding protein [Lactococcus formosensis]|jgi:RNA-binding protein YlmH|uniref:RNA-binding protein n=1 Tax=Lactococcus formosensis TaxID=1281486 RepID=A0A9Q9D6I2_9LACT|nr:RNA-binding protein [Lactococcus formosensis]MCO7181027.1 RNA-binding protein [Lactococcus formosensis]MDG6112138.1 RNA-binding protein [Lactococcus formosensis]MDG6118369.1 RNA-binding protein [Lactococcus formosensis]MDG6120399.1 RNA-binding protein [Lactococcus formosensis]MDG6139227.1 RNA-binding protein [Lactococcus formosensis]
MSYENIYQHFHPDEKQFIDRVLDWMDRVENNYSVVTTYFLNPREVEILESLANKRELQIFSTQDIAQTELTKIIIAPEFYQLDESDFDLALLEISYAKKFYQLKHSQILGSFLGQTGIRRSEIGDIVLNEGRAQVFVSKHLLEIFQNNIEKIGPAPVKFMEKTLEELIKTEDTSVIKVILVSSLRIDKIIASTFEISRNLAVNMLQLRKVKLNYLEIEKKDFPVEQGDLISVRGLGRIKVLKILGETKKGKQKIECEITKNHKKK